jgi:hypothetical protein
MSVWAKETFVNATENYLIDETEPYETSAETTGELYRACLKEYGRCVSSMYVDTKEKTLRVGWVFEGRDKYEDTEETYLRQVWVAVVDGPEVVTRKVNYIEV